MNTAAKDSGQSGNDMDNPPSLPPTPPAPVQLHGFTLQPVTARLEAALKRIDSPLLAVFDTALRNREKTTGEIAALVESEIKPTAEAAIETVFLFVTPIREAWSLLDAGREIFRSHALETIGEKLHPLQLSELQRACAGHYLMGYFGLGGEK